MDSTPHEQLGTRSEFRQALWTHSKDVEIECIVFYGTHIAREPYKAVYTFGPRHESPFNWSMQEW